MEGIWSGFRRGAPKYRWLQRIEYMYCSCGVVAGGREPAGRAPVGAPANRQPRNPISFFRRHQGERPPRDHQLSPTSPTQLQSHSRVMLQCAGEFGKAFRRYAAGQPTPSPSITTITQAKAKRQTSAGVRHLPTRSCCSFPAILDAARGTRTYCCRP